MGAAWSAVAHSPFAGGLSHVEDLGAICWICWAVIWVFDERVVGAAEARKGRRGRRRVVVCILLVILGELRMFCGVFRGWECRSLLYSLTLIARSTVHIQRNRHPGDKECDDHSEARHLTCASLEKCLAVPNKEIIVQEAN